MDKETQGHRIVNPRASKPVAGHGVKIVEDMANDFQTPNWSSGICFRYHHCGIVAQIEPSLEKIERDLNGLRLKNYHQQPYLDSYANRSCVLRMCVKV
jgi:hypothetical protein